MNPRTLLLPAALTAAGTASARPAQTQPNIVVILADDLGFSDIGCYGGEIHTPNLDRLAANGLRFNNFYNTSRSCPTRASLLTGLYQHQAGIGRMTFDDHLPGYRGTLSKNAVTIAEALRGSGYHTGMVGKWHIAETPLRPDQREWLAHHVYHEEFADKINYPTHRGFEDFYGKIRGGVLATTSAANVGQFQEAMRPILAAGKDIVSINFSSALSTTYQSACIAAQDMKEEFPDANIYVVDSLSASLGQGLLLYLTVQKKREGLSAQELVRWVEDNKLHIDHWFTVDDLNYLKMGGRLSAGAAFFGSMLSIKPVMHTSDEGKLVPVSKVRGRKASLKALIDKIAELGIEPSEQVMFICHADCEVEARAVAEEMKARYGVKEVYINYIGPVIGSHTGPNTMGIFFVGTKR